MERLNAFSQVTSNACGRMGHRSLPGEMPFMVVIQDIKIISLSLILLKKRMDIHASGITSLE